jgi:hypothetical protein
MLAWKSHFKQMLLSLNIVFTKSQFYGYVWLVLTFFKFHYLENEAFVWGETFRLTCDGKGLHADQISGGNSRIWFNWIFSVIGRSTSKMVNNLKRKSIGHYPFGLFSSLIWPYVWAKYQLKSSESFRTVLSSVKTCFHLKLSDSLYTIYFLSRAQNY